MSAASTRPSSVRAWLERVLAGLRVGTCFLFLTAPAWADNPIERLQNGDLQGFTEDALRTDWVVAVTAGTGAGLLGPAVASVLRRFEAEGQKLEELDRAVEECRAETARLQKQYDAEKARLDFADRKLLESAGALDLYEQQNRVADGVAIAWLAYAAVGLYKVAACYVSSTAVATGGGGATLTAQRLGESIARTQARISALKTDIAQVKLQIEAAAAHLQDALAMSLYGKEQLLQREMGTLAQYQAELAKLVAPLEQVASQAGSEAAQLGGRLAVGAFGLAQGAWETVRSTSLSALRSLKDAFYLGKADEWRRQIRELQAQVGERKRKNAELWRQLQDQMSHCKALAAQLDAQHARVSTALTKSKRALTEAKIKGSTQEEILQSVRRRAEELPPRKGPSTGPGK